MESIVINTPATPAPAGHDAAMIAKVDAVAAKNAPAGEPVRPDWLPAKFKTVEEMASSYAALEAKLGAPKDTPPVTPAAAPAAAPKTDLTVPEADPAAAAAVSKAGLDMAALNAEFAAEGKLSEASMAALANSGIDQATVDSYIAGRQALQEKFSSEAMAETPGGAEKYPEMIAWAKANMTDAEIAAYNTAVSSGNLAQAKLAVAGLGARFAADVGSEPNLIGGAPGASAGDVFESTAQLTAAMKDPRYTSDPAYRNAVREKLGRSDIF
jgi:hypothetical protein